MEIPLAQYHIYSVWQLSDPTDFPDPLAPVRHQEFSIDDAAVFFFSPAYYFARLGIWSSPRHLFHRTRATADGVDRQQSAGQMAQQVAELQKVADRWDEAVYQHDQYALELVLAPQYINISDTGEVTNGTSRFPR